MKKNSKYPVRKTKKVKSTKKRKTGEILNRKNIGKEMMNKGKKKKKEF